MSREIQQRSNKSSVKSIKDAKSKEEVFISKYKCQRKRKM